MTAQILDGSALAKKYRESIRARAKAVRDAGGTVRLDAVLVDSGDNGARVYAENQGKTCRELGIDYRLHELPSTSTFDDISGCVRGLNEADDVCAIMLHMPLPADVEPYRIQCLISPDKDVEGVNPANIGNVVYGRSSLAPCTGLAVVKMLEHTHQELRGKCCVVVGASDVVGKPIAVLLMRTDATVISCNKWTYELPALTRRADVLVAAAGVPGLIKADMVKDGATVVDVGVNRVHAPDGKTKTVGDVDFEAVKEKASWISPVPGGVGPMTVAMLLLNVIEAAERRTRCRKA